MWLSQRCLRVISGPEGTDCAKRAWDVERSVFCDGRLERSSTKKTKTNNGVNDNEKLKDKKKEVSEK